MARLRNTGWSALVACQRRRVLLAYIVPSALSLIAVQTWFEPGTVIAFGDLPPPVAAEADYTSHWSHLTAGEGAPTYDIVGLPYSAWLDGWTWLGASEALGQRIWLSALFAGSAAAVVFLAFGFTSSTIAAGTAGLLASFNAYRLITGSDAVPMMAIVVAALLSGFVVRAALSPTRSGSVLGFAVASLGLGFVMSNPPHVGLVLLWVGACAAIALFAHEAGRRRMFAFLAKAVPLALLLNAWWIVPAWFAITAPGFDERFAAAGVDEWAWTHERATFANALTLNTAWGWSYPEYFPYAERLGGLPFGPLKGFLPVLAAIGVLLAPRVDRRIAVGLVVTALVAAWLTTGLQAPIPAVNRWLYDEVPGYWLFREPTKLLMLVVLPVALLSGLAVGRLLNDRRRPWRSRAVAGGLVVGALLYVHPLFTGDVIPDERPLLPSAHVDVPTAWKKTAATLNAQRDGGKVLILPRSDFYQVPTTWGYYGVPFTRSMVRHPVLESQPGGYFRPVSSVSALEESIENDLLSGFPREVHKTLAALGVRNILLRRDIDADFPNRHIAQPEVIRRSLARLPGVRKLRSFGMLDLYRVTEATGNEVFAATPVFYAGSSDALAPAISAIREGSGFVSEPDDRRSLVKVGVRPARVLRFEEDMVRRVAVKRQRRNLVVRLSDPFRLSLGSRTLPRLPAQRIAVPLVRDTQILVSAGNALLPLRRVPHRWLELGLVGLKKGQVVSVWRLAHAEAVDPASAGPAGDCDPTGTDRPEETGIDGSVVRVAGQPTLRLTARAGSACVDIPLVDGRSPDLYRVRFRYRQLRGSPARTCLWQHGIDRCAPVSALRPSRGWQTFEATIRPHPRMTRITLFLYADGRGQPPATVTEYQGIRVDRYRRAIRVPYASTGTHVLPGSPFSERTLAIARAALSRPVELSRAGPVGDCHRYDSRTPAELGLAARVTNRSGSPVLRLAARDHSACVDFAISPFEPDSNAYRIRFEYRRMSGNSARACLWQEGPDRCISFSELRSDGEWRVLDETVRLDPNVRALRLFLYADGGGDRRTVTEYRDVRIAPVGSVALIGVPRARPLPRIVARRQAPWKFRVRVTDARAPFLLVASEAFSPGWEASADGRDASSLRHVEVNGYANGWLVPWKGSYELTLEYEPERYARAARWLSLIAVQVVVFVWIARRIRRFIYVPRT